MKKRSYSTIHQPWQVPVSHMCVQSSEIVISIYKKGKPVNRVLILIEAALCSLRQHCSWGSYEYTPHYALPLSTDILTKKKPLSLWAEYNAWQSMHSPITTKRCYTHCQPWDRPIIRWLRQCQIRKQSLGNYWEPIKQEINKLSNNWIW